MKTRKKIQLALKYYFMYLLQWLTVRTGLMLAKPSHIYISNSINCNLRCQMCNNWLTLKDEHENISKERMQEILQEIRTWLGVVKVTFCGPGETFMNPNIFSSIKYASEIGLYVIVTSNGTLISKEYAHKLINSKVMQMNISLDGIQAHDYLRGVEGTYLKAITGIKNLCEVRNELNSPLKIMINCTVMGPNLNELIELGLWAKANDVKIRFNPLTLSPEEDYKTNLWIKDYLKLDHVMDQLQKQRKNSNHILNFSSDFNDMKSYFRGPEEFLHKKRDGVCLGSVESLFINYNGNILTCKSLGDIHSSTLRDIWNSSEAKTTIKELRKCDNRCLDRAREKGNLFNRMMVFFRAVG